MTCDHFWIEITGIKGAKLPKPFWSCGRCGEKSDEKQKVWDGGKKMVEERNKASKETNQVPPEVGEEGRKIPPLGALPPPNWTGKGWKPMEEVLSEVKSQIEDDPASGSQIYKEPDYETKQKFIQDRVKLLKQVLTMAYLCIGVALFCIAAGIYMGEYELVVPGPIFMLGSGFFVMWMIKGKLRALGEPYDTLKRFK